MNKPAAKTCLVEDRSSVALSFLNITPDILNLLPASIALHHRVLPFQKCGDQVSIATSDPSNLTTLDCVKAFFAHPVEFVTIAADELDQLLARYYTNKDLAPKNDAQAISFSMQEECHQTPIITIVSNLLQNAYECRASDIHFEPIQDRFRVRFRIDGLLQEIRTLPSTLQEAIISRIKIITGSMSIAEKRLPQDGRIAFHAYNNNKHISIDLRVSIIPTVYGESAVIRILDHSALHLSNLGLSTKDQIRFENLIAAPHGLILITGPTGSGKTTTLYASLASINKPSRKLITVEDPIEYQLTGVNQVQVNPAIGMTFPAALRSILRQAPNVLMIGEIRDAETAIIATNASITGHLVLSTLHTRDAPSAVSRLVDIGIQPFLISASLRAVIAQRLVRKLCPHCKIPTTFSEREKRILAIESHQSETGEPMTAVGCKACHGKGYCGRLGIFEIFVLDEESRTLINHNVPTFKLRNYAITTGMVSLLQDGLKKVLCGLTTAQEIITNTMRE